MLAGRISAKKEISSKTGKEGSIYPGRCRQGLSEDWTLKQGLGGQGEVAEVSPGEKHRETGWVAFRRGRGRCGRGRGRVAGKAEETDVGNIFYLLKDCPLSRKAFLRYFWSCESGC